MKLPDLFDAVHGLLDDLPDGVEERLYEAFAHIDKIAFARGYNQCAEDFNLGVTIVPDQSSII
jgi:hypothetical protein